MILTFNEIKKVIDTVNLNNDNKVRFEATTVRASNSKNWIVTKFQGSTKITYPAMTITECYNYIYKFL
jgi:hypothetical protein